MLILVVELAAADIEADKQHISRHEQRGDAGEKSQDKADTRDQLHSFSNIEQELRCGQCFNDIPFKVRFHGWTIEDFQSMIVHQQTNNNADGDEALWIPTRSRR